MCVSKIKLSGTHAKLAIIHLPCLVVLEYPVLARVESVARLSTHRILLAHIDKCALETDGPLQFSVQSRVVKYVLHFNLLARRRDGHKVSPISVVARSWRYRLITFLEITLRRLNQMSLK